MQYFLRGKRNAALKSIESAIFPYFLLLRKRLKKMDRKGTLWPLEGPFERPNVISRREKNAGIVMILALLALRTLRTEMRSKRFFFNEFSCDGHKHTKVHRLPHHACHIQREWRRKERSNCEKYERYEKYMLKRHQREMGHHL